MARKQFTLEYVIRSSPAILYDFLVTPANLALWFADNCDVNKEYNREVYTFSWGEDAEQAELVDDFEEEFVRYHWVNTPQNESFSFKISKSEISFDTVLTITDFAEEKEMKNQKFYWDNLMEELRRHIGG